MLNVTLQRKRHRFDTVKYRLLAVQLPAVDIVFYKD